MNRLAQEITRSVGVRRRPPAETNLAVKDNERAG